VRQGFRSSRFRLVAAVLLLAVWCPLGARAEDEMSRERNLVVGLDAAIEQNRAEGERVLSVGGEPFKTEAQKLAVAHLFFTGEKTRFDVLYEEPDGSKRQMPITLTAEAE
jgi:hypothetical protein